MEKQIDDILNDIDEEILLYEGNNLFDEGLLDSFAVIEIISQIELRIGIKISPDDVTEENFRTRNNIIMLVKKLVIK